MTKNPQLELPHPATEFHVSVYNGNVDVSAYDSLSSGGTMSPDDAERFAENVRAAAAYARLHPGKPPRAPRADVGLGQGAGVTVDVLLTRPSAMQARIADMMQETSVVEQMLRARGTDDDGQPVRYLTVTTMDPT